jgi:hypothetical protein
MKNEERSRIMRAVRSTDTAPELFVRRLVHRLGYPFRLHRRDLAGKPDLVFPSRRKVIFVHGCFWHGHDCGILPVGDRPQGAAAGGSGSPEGLKTGGSNSKTIRLIPVDSYGFPIATFAPPSAQPQTDSKPIPYW